MTSTPQGRVAENIPTETYHTAIKPRYNAQISRALVVAVERQPSADALSQADFLALLSSAPDSPNARDSVTERSCNGNAMQSKELHELTVFQLLLANGDPNTISESGASVLHNAVFAGNEEVVLHLLRAQADVDIRLPYCAWTPLHRAAAAGATRCARLLLAFGANPAAVKSDGGTPAMLAIRNGHHGVARMLHQHVAYTGALCGQDAHAVTNGAHPQNSNVGNGSRDGIGVMMSLQQCCAVVVRRSMPDRTTMLDALPLPHALKSYLNFYKPYKKHIPPPQPPAVCADRSDELRRGGGGVCASPTHAVVHTAADTGEAGVWDQKEECPRGSGQQWVQKRNRQDMEEVVYDKANLVVSTDAPLLYIYCLPPHMLLLGVLLWCAL